MCVRRRVQFLEGYGCPDPAKSAGFVPPYGRQRLKDARRGRNWLERAGTVRAFEWRAPTARRARPGGHLCHRNARFGGGLAAREHAMARTLIRLLANSPPSGRAIDLSFYGLPVGGLSRKAYENFATSQFNAHAAGKTRARFHSRPRCHHRVWAAFHADHRAGFLPVMQVRHRKCPPRRSSMCCRCGCSTIAFRGPLSTARGIRSLRRRPVLGDRGLIIFVIGVLICRRRAGPSRIVLILGRIFAGGRWGAAGMGASARDLRDLYDREKPQHA